jgi:hypothetical protein
MQQLHDSGAGMRLEVSPAHAFAVVAFVQLGLRHPDASANASAPLAREFTEYVRAKFEPHAPAIAEAIRRGNDPEHDTPRQATRDPSPRIDGLIDRGRGLMEFISASETPRTPEEIVAFMDSRRDPAPLILTCPHCGWSTPAPFEKVDLYICANCGRTVDGGAPI